MKTVNKKRAKNNNIKVSGKLDWRYLLFFIAGVLVTFLFYSLFGSNGGANLKANPTEQKLNVDSGSDWQKWEYTTIKLERPEDTFPPMEIKPMDILWLFPNKTENDVEQLFKSCNLDPVLEKSLLDKSRWKNEPAGIVVSPTAESVKDLPLEARRKIYSILRKDQSNFFHFNPFRILPGELDEWLANSGLSPENQELFRKVCWREGEYILFFDYQLLEHIITNPAEKRRVARALSQIPALMMNLKVTPQTDVDAVVKYFEKGRGRDMKSFLESLKRLPEGRSVNVAFFLPPFARLRLYTYPMLTPGQKPYDCFYSGMNFFNETPDDRFLNSDYIQQVLHKQYYNVGTNYTFGDLLLLLEDGNKAIHMCVYIADNVVFTKNGAQDLQPWILMKIPDMLKIYQTDKPLQILAYRRKD